MAKLITHCPSCNNSSVQVRKIECGSCGTTFEGAFEIPRLALLPPADLNFVEQFLLASGSLKEMAKQLGVSYPTVRNRLNHIIAVVEKMSSVAESEQDGILAALENGSITAKEAAMKLQGR